MNPTLSPRDIPAIRAQLQDRAADLAEARNQRNLGKQMGWWNADLEAGFKETEKNYKSVAADLAAARRTR